LEMGACRRANIAAPTFAKKRISTGKAVRVKFGVFFRSLFSLSAFRDVRIQTRRAEACPTKHIQLIFEAHANSAPCLLGYN
jgi:hypothetical protein